SLHLIRRAGAGRRPSGDNGDTRGFPRHIQLDRDIGSRGGGRGGCRLPSMSSAAFAQARQGFTGSARLSAVYTGVSYFITAVILATPYFLTPSQVVALSASLVLAVIIVASITYYSSVISGKGFSRDFLEILGIMFGTTLVLYLLGSFIRIAIGITI